MFASPLLAGRKEDAEQSESNIPASQPSGATTEQFGPPLELGSAAAGEATPNASADSALTVAQKHAAEAWVVVQRAGNHPELLASAMEDLANTIQRVGRSAPRDEEPADLKALKKAIAEGVDVRSALGQKFARTVDKNMLKGKSHKEKAEFRKEWAEREYKTLCETKYKDTQHQIIDTMKGEYVSLPVLIDRFGGQANPVAIKAGVTYATKCYILGSQWVSYNAMAEIDEFLHFRKQHREIFSTIWGLRSKQSCAAERKASSSVAHEEADAEAVQTPAALPAANLPETPEGKPKKGRTGDPPQMPKPTPKEKSALNLAISAAAKMKSKYEKVVVQASNLKGCLDMPSWGWARGAAVLDDFVASFAALNNEIKDFSQEFLSRSVNELKRTMSSEELQANLHTMVKSLEPCIDALAQETKSLLALEAAKSKSKSLNAKAAK
jgi:hypothetical protein